MSGRQFLLAGALLALSGCVAAELETAPAVDRVAVTGNRMAAFPMADSVANTAAYAPAQIIAGGPSAWFDAAPAGTIDPAALDRAEAYAAAQGSYSLIVLRDGAVVRETYWGGFGPDSRFSTASLHKTVLALAYGPAVSAGKISLDAPVSRYLSEWRGDSRGTITIRQLLSMSSGFTSPAVAPTPTAPGMQLMFAPDIAAVARETVQSIPAGVEFAYANVNPQLAGEALSRALGEDYAGWLSRKIWAPIGAADAALWLDREGGSPHYFCCLQARARDWALIGELIRNQGRSGNRQVVAREWIAGMTAASPLNPNYGLMIWRGSPHAPDRRYSRDIAMTVKAAQPFAAADVAFLDGAGGQRVYAIPSAGLTIVRIGKPSLTWDDSALPNLVLAGLR